VGLVAVRDLRVAREPVTAEDLVALETDVLAGFVLAGAAAGLADGTIASDVMHLEQVRAWLGHVSASLVAMGTIAANAIEKIHLSHSFKEWLEVQTNGILNSESIGSVTLR